MINAKTKSDDIICRQQGYSEVLLRRILWTKYMYRVYQMVGRVYVASYEISRKSRAEETKIFEIC